MPATACLYRAAAEIGVCAGAALADDAGLVAATGAGVRPRITSAPSAPPATPPTTTRAAANATGPRRRPRLPGDGGAGGAGGAGGSYGKGSVATKPSSRTKSHRQMTQS